MSTQATVMLASLQKRLTTLRQSWVIWELRQIDQWVEVLVRRRLHLMGHVPGVSAARSLPLDRHSRFTSRM